MNLVETLAKWPMEEADLLKSLAKLSRPPCRGQDDRRGALLHLCRDLCDEIDRAARPRGGALALLPPLSLKPRGSRGIPS